MGFVMGLLAGGAIIYLCPGLGTGGNSIYRRFIKPRLQNIKIRF